MMNRYLPTALRRALEKTAKEARIVAEEGAWDAIRRLGVADSKAPVYLKDEEKELRRRLRAHARALGDAFDKTDETQETKRLVEAAAYAHWHRMLFARFLAERGLLRNPEYDVPVSLEDCRELAEAEGLTDPWATAERYAASMLPAVFRIDDPVLALDLDPVHTQKLHRLVTRLDPEVFQAEDSLGWTYQFWRAAEKDAVNVSGVKIGADELPAVTQLFTEPYMVRFLLHNTLGAWWAGKVLAANPLVAQTAMDEDALRKACSLPDYSFDMLRFVRENEDSPWRPAAGTFPGWPKEAKGITMLDPCCGSGHFLTEALAILAELRRAEEELSSSDAVALVLQDNLHGLEIDGRCVQIAAFAVGLTAWRIGGWQTLPTPHIAWVGAPPPLPKRDFIGLADGNPDLELALAALYDLFMQAPILGSLLEPTGGDLVSPGRVASIEKLIVPLIEKVRQGDPETLEGVVAARGMADAVKMLSQRYTLQCTNVPYLGRGNQCDQLASYIDSNFQLGKADLSAAMTLRMKHLAKPNCSIALVTPQSWLFAGGYKKMRKRFLAHMTMNIFGSLGSRAFETITGEVVNTALLGITNSSPTSTSSIACLDVNLAPDAGAKASALREAAAVSLNQIKQLSNPDSRVLISQQSKLPLLSEIADCYKGIATGDMSRFIFRFWEFADIAPTWSFLQEAPSETSYCTARSAVIRWEQGNGSLLKFVGDRLGEGGVGAWLRGGPAWGNRGIAIAQMSSLPATIYSGNLFDESTGVLVPRSASKLPAIWAFVSSQEYSKSIRSIDKSLKVPTLTLLKVPFDEAYWTRIAESSPQDFIAEPFSVSPDQWLFHGHPALSRVGTALHVALARLTGYRWPAENDPEMQLSAETSAWLTKTSCLPIGDVDGLVGVPPVAGEKSLADRLRAYLAASFGSEWTDALERRLVTEADDVLDKKVARDGSLECWVRDRAFRQHCVLFDQRPFLWHISDGLKDGFSVFVHYHRLDQANLRKLTYTLLGDWLARAKAENNALRYEKGRELQQKLERVLEGEKPYDIFVRWKSLVKQPLGWDPDLDDGVRQNIRPLVKAGVLTHDLSKILKDKDRGGDIASAPWYPVFNGERRNDHHTTLIEKRAAREAAARRAEAAK